MDESNKRLFLAVGGYLDRHNVVRVLIEKGAKVNASDGEGNRPLHYAAARDHIGTLETLIKGGANVNAKNRRGETPLFAAADHGHESAIRRLVSHGADAMATDGAGQSSLDRATARGDTKTANVLREVNENSEGRLANLPIAELQRRRADIERVASLLDAELARRESKKRRSR